MEEKQIEVVLEKRSYRSQMIGDLIRDNRELWNLADFLKEFNLSQGSYYRFLEDDRNFSRKQLEFILGTLQIQDEGKAAFIKIHRALFGLDEATCFGELLSKLIAYEGLNIFKLATSTSIKPTIFYCWLKADGVNNQLPSSEQLSAIKEVLDITMQDAKRLDDFYLELILELILSTQGLSLRSVVRDRGWVEAEKSPMRKLLDRSKKTLKSICTEELGISQMAFCRHVNGSSFTKVQIQVIARSAFPDAPEKQAELIHLNRGVIGLDRAFLLGKFLSKLIEYRCGSVDNFCKEGDFGHCTGFVRELADFVSTSFTQNQFNEIVKKLDFKDDDPEDVRDLAKLKVLYAEKASRLSKDFDEMQLVCADHVVAEMIEGAGHKPDQGFSWAARSLAEQGKGGERLPRAA